MIASVLRSETEIVDLDSNSEDSQNSSSSDASCEDAIPLFEASKTGLPADDIAALNSLLASALEDDDTDDVWNFIDGSFGAAFDTYLMDTIVKDIKDLCKL